jgi:hypothetical protein
LGMRWNCTLSHPCAYEQPCERRGAPASRTTSAATAPARAWSGSR